MSEFRRRMAFNRNRWNFAVVGDKGAIHLGVYPSQDGRPDDGGIEMHSRKQLYEHSKEPTHTNCWLLGADCWHDGSTLQAREFWLPLFDSCNRSGDFEPLWTALEGDYRQRFESD